MIYSDRTIYQKIQAPLWEGGIRIQPFVSTQVSPASYDVRLGSPLLVYPRIHSSIEEQEPDRHTLTSEPFILRPGVFALGTTEELITLGNRVTARIAGKSSRAREGLSIEFAGWVDPGFSGEITLELIAHRPVRLTYGMKIGQIVFLEADESMNTYDYVGHYHGQTGPTESWEVQR